MPLHQLSNSLFRRVRWLRSTPTSASAGVLELFRVDCEASRFFSMTVMSLRLPAWQPSLLHAVQ